MSALPRLFVGLLLCLGFFFAGDFILTRFFPSADGEPKTLLAQVGQLMREARLADEIQGRQQSSLHRIHLKQEVVDDMIAGRISVREAYACFVEINAEAKRADSHLVGVPPAQALQQWTLTTLKRCGQHDPALMARLKKELEEAQRDYRDREADEVSH